MLSRKDNSDFGWDEHKQLVVAEDVVWNSYINIVEEIDVEDVATVNIPKKKETIIMNVKLMYL
ncbi:hypothetical protein Goklo_026529 [Gossypium klotzschianum]|nr:hypothetical protein [Gossypium klotzschianum]